MQRALRRAEEDGGQRILRLASGAATLKWEDLLAALGRHVTMSTMAQYSSRCSRTIILSMV